MGCAEMSSLKDEKGKRYSRLVVVCFNGRDRKGGALWTCLCDCGKEAIVSGYQLRSGRCRSCGCLSAELSQARLGRLNQNYKLGERCGEDKEQRTFHEKIRARDNYTCQDCDKTQEQELKDSRRCLSVHHKNGDHSDNRDENAVTLCHKCHGVYCAEQSEQMLTEATLDAALLADDDVWLANQLADIE